MSRRGVFYFVLFYFTLFYFILFYYFVFLFYVVLFHIILFYFISFHLILFILVYSICSFSVLSVLLESLVIAIGCVSCSRVLHSKFLKNILRAPMSFFDTTPLGRIMNRFSKDVDIVDVTIPQFIRNWLVAVIPVLATVVVISYSTPVFLAAALPLAVLFALSQVQSESTLLLLEYGAPFVTSRILLISYTSVLQNCRLTILSERIQFCR